MNTTNRQTPGPLTVGRRMFKHEGQPLVADGERVAYVFPHLLAAEPNARTLAAGFNLLDKTGRVLKIDAATLGEGLDLVALIQAAQGAIEAMETHNGDLSGATYSLRAALSTLPPVTP